MIDINPFDPQTVVLLGALNPVTILVAFLMGRTADQWQKIPVAAFAGALRGLPALLARGNRRDIQHSRTRR